MFHTDFNNNYCSKNGTLYSHRKQTIYRQWTLKETEGLANPPQSIAIVDCRAGNRVSPPHASAFLHVPLDCPIIIPAPPLPPNYDLLFHLPQALNFIQQQLAIPNRNVLVHCASGRSRSVSVVCAYLIAQGRTLDQALAFIQTHRHININIHYQQQLQLCLCSSSTCSHSSSKQLQFTKAKAVMYILIKQSEK